MKFEYVPQGVCARHMSLEVEDGHVKSLKVTGGCNGNSKGLAALVAGMPVKEVIARLEGICCGHRQTSCPAQLALALRHLMQK
ncbi:MAG: TIGR03905 family TSCPD domain-containing protein [Proteobacteria bacterium]|nr:TIGR03905 family TSCPD domain-containing protein [Pseudomonadota bacterium]